MTIQQDILKLGIELVPRTCWEKNLRKQMSRSRWNKHRQGVFAEACHICQACGAGGTLTCHEIWDYDDEWFVQKLVGFRALCEMCNLVTHFGHTQILAAQGKVDLDVVIEHFMVVNGVGRGFFEAHRTEAFRIWGERSKHAWRADLGEWASLVGNEPLRQPTDEEKEAHSKNLAQLMSSFEFENGKIQLELRGESCECGGTMVQAEYCPELDGELSECQEADYLSGWWIIFQCRSCGTREWFQTSGPSSDSFFD